MKLRLLNGSHSTLAYLGFLSGHEFIWQASADPLLATLVERLMAEEVMPTLVAPPGVDLACLRRAAHAALSQSGIAASDAADRDGRLAEAAAAAARHGARTARRRRLDRAPRAGDRRLDSLRERRRRAWQADRGVRSAGGESSRRSPPLPAATPRRSPTGFLDLAEVFGADLVGNAVFRRAVSRDVGSLFRDGVRRTLAVHIAQHGS